MRSQAGDHVVEREGTKGEHEQVVPTETPAPTADPNAGRNSAQNAASSTPAGAVSRGSVAMASEGSGEDCDERATERRKEQLRRHACVDGPSQQEETAVAAVGTSGRQESRDNEETRTPSSCNENQLEQASSCEDNDGDDAAADAPQRNGLHRPKPLALTSKTSCGESVSDAGTDACEGDDEGGTSPRRLAEGVPGSPPAAIVPHLSMPGQRCRRPAPAFGGKHAVTSQDVCRQHQQGPIGDLMTWLNGAEVGDVMDPLSLPDLLHGQEYGPERSSDPGRSLPPSTAPAVLLSAAELADAPEAMGSVIDDGIDVDNDFDEDDFEEIPSDREAPPRAPPLAASSAPFMRPPTPEHTPRQLPMRQRLGGYCNSTSSAPTEGHNEEEEWLARQRLTGAIGRLVRYNEGDITPKDDILGLRCTRRGRIMVTAVRENGAAMRAGVAAGDELVSVDGRKDFVGHPAHLVHASLRAPVTLVFLGFVGKLQAEVRVKRPPEPQCGLAPGMDIVAQGVEQAFLGQASSHEVRDAVVFQQVETASLLISAGACAGQTAPSSDALQPATSASNDEEAAPATKTIYELQREDARNLVVNALGSAATTAAL